jgi:release factor glutamine methyltransferase
VEARVQFIQADLLSFPNPLTPQPADKPRFDLIAANLPYIPTHRLGSLEVARREPRLALDGGSDGLSMIRRLIEQAPAALAPGGLMLLELDCSHAGAASDIAHTFFPKAAVSVLPDLNELDRLLKIETILEDN